ncbi:uncharacterized protein LOC110727273 [Chenopodium quinoa]|uniref:uncharacterized protein LOC110727273 n=1 Tax=Chenopodium quinoa TaxID=63459 RepID=UPI000B7979CE|nr:uncharacterized protein LOC110727273 [Chenopodium quinoa]
MDSITLYQLHLFHSIDRDLFSRLVTTLKQQASQALLIMAFLFFLEDAKDFKIITNLIGLSDNLLVAVVNEVALCINCLKTKTLTTHGGSLHLLSRMMDKEISLKTIYDMKYTAISGVKVFLNDVCAWIFTDILIKVLPIPSNLHLNPPLFVPGFPHPTFGSLEIYLLPLNSIIPINGLLGSNKNIEAPIDDRTLFLTFSQGFPVSEGEVRQFFTKMCGNCIESFQMEIIFKNSSKVQSLYARLGLRSVAYMDKIMGGKHVAKFRSKGKHIWARKYERRDP